MNQYPPQFGMPTQQPIGFQPYYQQPIQPMQRPQLFGRLIASADESITANEVPMDSVAYFPVQGGKEIIAKAWNGDGGITTIHYTAVVDEPSAQENAPTIADVMNQLDNIQDMLQELPKPKRTTKKVSEDE